MVILAAALVCLRLGWWQWKVFEAARGTGQNLGYAMLWPVFSVSFIYMWLRFLHLEGTHGIEDTDDEADVATVAHDAALVAGDCAAATVTADRGDRADSTSRESDSAVGVVRERRHTRPAAQATESYTVGVGLVGGEDDDDPELAAYNRALARIAEMDERYGR